jgi:hypothetical protein
VLAWPDGCWQAVRVADETSSTSGDGDGGPPVPEGGWSDPGLDTAKGAEVHRRKLAIVFAQELAEHPGETWTRRALGSLMSVTAYVDDDADLAEMVAEGLELAREAPTREQVWSRSGPAGVVVVAHGPAWSLIARSGGPILLMAEKYTQVLRLDGDPGWQGELTAMVTGLIAASEGRDPTAGLAELPAPPPVPRGRGRTTE